MIHNDKPFIYSARLSLADVPPYILWFNKLEHAILVLHQDIFNAQTPNGRYRVGPNLILEINANRLIAIHCFERRKSIKQYHDETQISKMGKISTLAISATDQIPTLLKKILPEDEQKIYTNAGRLNQHWVYNLVDNIFKYIINQ